MSEVTEYKEQAVAAPQGNAPMSLIERALDRGADIATLEKLLELQERQEREAARKAFDAAMSALRVDLPKILKSRSVDYTSDKGRTNYKYEDLSVVTETLSPAMAAHGLSFRWRTNQEGGRIRVTCVISHRDGHSEETTLEAGDDNTGNKNHIQAIGSAVTYLQRYTLKAAVGVAAAPDDDAQAVTARPEKRAQPAFDEGPWLKRIDEMTPDNARAVQQQLRAEADKMPPQSLAILRGAFTAKVKRLNEMEAE